MIKSLQQIYVVHPLEMQEKIDPRCEVLKMILPVAIFGRTRGAPTQTWYQNGQQWYPSLH